MQHRHVSDLVNPLPGIVKNLFSTNFPVAAEQRRDIIYRCKDIQRHDFNLKKTWFRSQYLALALAEVGRFDEAENILTYLIKNFPNEHTLYFNYALLFEKKGDYDKADEAYKVALKKFPEDKILIISYAYFLQTKCDDRFATFNLLENYLKQYPNCSKGLLAMSICEESFGNFEKALEYVKLSIKADRTNHSAYSQLGHCYQNMVHYKVGTDFRKREMKARAAFTMAKRLKPSRLEKHAVINPDSKIAYTETHYAHANVVTKSNDSELKPAVNLTRDAHFIAPSNQPLPPHNGFQILALQAKFHRLCLEVSLQYNQAAKIDLQVLSPLRQEIQTLANNHAYQAAIDKLLALDARCKAILNAPLKTKPLKELPTNMAASAVAAQSTAPALVGTNTSDHNEMSSSKQDELIDVSPPVSDIVASDEPSAKPVVPQQKKKTTHNHHKGKNQPPKHAGQPLQQRSYHPTASKNLCNQFGLFAISTATAVAVGAATLYLSLNRN